MEDKVLNFQSQNQLFIGCDFFSEVIVIAS